MAADFHIHVLEGATQAEAEDFERPIRGGYPVGGTTGKNYDDLYAIVRNTPNIWIGEVSWLKASLCNDPERFVPDPVAKISEIIGWDFPVIDDELIHNVIVALGGELRPTGYEVTDQAQEVKEFLEQHKGKQVFQVSW